MTVEVANSAKTSVSTYNHILYQNPYVYISQINSATYHYMQNHTPPYGITQHSIEQHWQFSTTYLRGVAIK